MNKKIVVVDNMEKLATIPDSYAGYVVNNGVFAFYGNSRKISKSKKALKRKVQSCLEKMKEKGWEVEYYGENNLCS